MKCECKKVLEAKLEEHVKKALPEGFERHRADLEGFGLGIVGDSMVLQLAIPYTGDVLVPKKAGGLKKQKINTFVVASYCPFCGTKCG